MENQIQSMTMSELKFGDIILIKFPFTDLSGAKKRPALVLHDTNDNDIIICRITSQAKESDFDIEITDQQRAGLKLSSIIRLHKIVTIEKTLVDKKMGTLCPADAKSVEGMIRAIVSKSF